MGVEGSHKAALTGGRLKVSIPLSVGAFRDSRPISNAWLCSLRPVCLMGDFWGPQITHDRRDPIPDPRGSTDI